MFRVALPLTTALKLYASVKFFSVSSIIFIYYCVFNYKKEYVWADSKTFVFASIQKIQNLQQNDTWVGLGRGLQT